MLFAEVVVTFNAMVAGCPLIEVVALVQDAPDGRPEHVKETFPANPATGVRLKLYVAVLPCVTVCEAEESESWKSVTESARTLLVPAR
jgi:hypothetical protein